MQEPSFNPVFQDLLDRILEILLGSWPDDSFPGEQGIDFRSEDFAVLNAAVLYSNTHVLYFAVGVEIAEGNPNWLYYNFQFQTNAGQLVFRYDNSEHYPWLPYFPHHKHTGLARTVEPVRRPSIHQIAREIAAYLEHR